MSLLRDATGVGFVWPPARAGRRGQGMGMGMGSPAARARIAPSGDGFRRWGGMEGAMLGPERAGCAGASLTVKLGGVGCAWKGAGESLFLFWF